MILADARRELELLHTKTVNLVQQYELYKAQFKQLAAAQLEVISSESFQIHVANLDAFLTKSQPESVNQPENEFTDDYPDYAPADQDFDMPEEEE